SSRTCPRRSGRPTAAWLPPSRTRSDPHPLIGSEGPPVRAGGPSGISGIIVHGHAESRPSGDVRSRKGLCVDGSTSPHQRALLNSAGVQVYEEIATANGVAADDPMITTHPQAVALLLELGLLHLEDERYVVVD